MLFVSSTELEVNASQEVGQAIIFPSHVTHRVLPVIKGERHSLVLWLKVDTGGAPTDLASWLTHGPMSGGDVQEIQPTCKLQVSHPDGRELSLHWTGKDMDGRLFVVEGLWNQGTHVEGLWHQGTHAVCAVDAIKMSLIIINITNHCEVILVQYLNLFDVWLNLDVIDHVSQAISSFHSPKTLPFRRSAFTGWLAGRFSQSLWCGSRLSSETLAIHHPTVDQRHEEELHATMRGETRELLDGDYIV